MRRCILATCAIILVAGLCLDARAADVRTKSGSKQPVFSPTGAKGAKLDKPLNADQIKKIVKKKLKQDHASINLFELILFRNRQVKETVPEKSCFKYNLAALGFALNSFADTINSVEFANSKNALPAEVIFSFQANGIRMPDVVKTKFHPPASERASFIELSEKLAGAPILMRPETLTTEGYLRAVRHVVAKLSNMHKRAQDSMVCSFGHLKSFASQRRCWQILKESKNLLMRLAEIEKNINEATFPTPLIMNKGEMYCKVPVQWNSVLKANANSLLSIQSCNLQMYRKGKCDSAYKSWFGKTKTCRDPKKLNLNGGANGVIIKDLVKIFPTLMQPTAVDHPKMEIENLESTFLSSKDMRLDTTGNGTATLFYNCGGVCWARCLSSLDCLKGESTIIRVRDMDHIDKRIRARIKVTVSKADFLIEDLSHELEPVVQLDSRNASDNSTVGERRAIEEKLNTRLKLQSKKLAGSS
eukprot:g5231.t1